MTLVVTVDNNNGISFCERPLSTDSVVVEKIEALEDAVWLNEHGIGPVPFNNWLDWGKIDTVALFRWNRVYPADRIFKWPANQNFILDSFENFEGSSHYITMEIYKKRKE